MTQRLQQTMAAVAHEQPQVHQLAVLASLAARIEPPLLRRLRLRLMPDAEPGLESDLWFSPLVQSFDTDACLLQPWIANQLRIELKRSGRLEAVWRILQAAHTDAPPSQRIEERVAYLALSDGDYTASIVDALRGALKAMVLPERGVKVARWALHALPRLPQPVAALPEAVALRRGMAARIHVGQAQAEWSEKPLFDDERDGWVLPRPRPVAGVVIGLRHEGSALAVCEPVEVDAAAALTIPDSRARRMQVRVNTSSGLDRYTVLRGFVGERVTFDAMPSDIEVTTETGEVYGFEAAASASVTAGKGRVRSSIRDCTYSAYVSFSNDDNLGWNNWVTQFAKQLERALGGRSRVKNVPPLYYGEDTWPLHGRLSDGMKRTIASSFAMVVVVHDNYARSDWCLKELECFHELFGDDGLRDRLYIVAMSEPAMRRVEQEEIWKRLVPHDQVWLAFFEADRRDKPTEIYQGVDDFRSVLSDDFFKPFDRLLTDLARKISRSANAVPSRADAVTDAAAVSKRSALRAKPSTEARAPPPSGVLFGAATPELDEAVAALRDSLLPVAGLRIEMLRRDVLFGDFAEFDAAETLVLPFGSGQPLLPAAGPGGHLAVQRDAWGSRGKPADSLVWLDLRQLTVLQPARAPHDGFIAALAAQAVMPADLPARLSLAAPDAAGGARDGDGDVDVVHIYIESNRHERLLWRPLGERIKEKWDALIAGQQIAPRIHMRPRGLPIDEIDRQFSLDDADGVVLFWGQKEPRSLLSQINKVEDRLSGRDVPPCIVAYLMPPQPDPKTPIVSWAWDILRFNVAGEATEVLLEDAPELDGFLQRVLHRCLARRASTDDRSVRVPKTPHSQS